MLALVLWLWSTLALAAPVHVLELTGGVDPGSADYLVQGIRDAEEADAAAVVIVMDTPGGLLTSTREIVQAQLAAGVPVVVHVAPAGARAGSAGVFITLASHVAAMAPGTTIGAAHPVGLFGSGGEEGDAEVMEQKILEDTLAWVRAIAEQRGRNADWAESAVRESAAVTAQEALELDVIDVLAPDLDALLDAIDGRTVETRAGTVVLATAGAEVVRVPMSLRQRVVHLLGDPNVLFVLIGLGFLGLYMELQSPGMLVPGGVGVVCLVGAAIGLSILPFNVGGLLLVLLGLVLLGLEAFTPTFGVLTTVGAASLLFGGFLLFQVEGFDLRIGRGLLIGVAIATALAALGLAWLIARDRGIRPHLGSEGMVGAVGEVIEGGEEAGRVRIAGEIWRARWKEAMEAGDPVRVTAVHGLRLDVEPEREPGGE